MEWTVLAALWYAVVTVRVLWGVLRWLVADGAWV
jgi:hypothetical protein